VWRGLLWPTCSTRSTLNVRESFVFLSYLWCPQFFQCDIRHFDSSVKHNQNKETTIKPTPHVSKRHSQIQKGLLWSGEDTGPEKQKTIRSKRVRWKGYDSEEESWMKEKDVTQLTFLKITPFRCFVIRHVSSFSLFPEFPGISPDIRRIPETTRYYYISPFFFFLFFFSFCPGFRILRKECLNYWWGAYFRS
jgi:hypothetical protein